MTKTVLYSTAIASVGILLIAIMSFDVAAHASSTETEREFDIPTLNFRAADSVIAFVVRADTDPDSETFRVQMITSNPSRSIFVCDVPKENIKIKKPLGNLSIEYNTNDSDVTCALQRGDGGGVSLTIEPNGKSTFKYKSNNEDCNVEADGITVGCIRVKENNEGGSIDVSGTLFGKSFDNGEGEMGLKNTHIKTWTKNLNDN